MTFSEHATNVIADAKARLGDKVSVHSISYAYAIEVHGQPHSFTRKCIHQRKLDCYVNKLPMRERTSEELDAIRGAY